MEKTQTVRLGLLGCGTVGTSFCQLITQQASEIQRRTGLALEIARVAVRDRSKARDGVDAALLTEDPKDVVENPEIDIVICLLYTSPSPRDATLSRMPSSA